MSFCLTMKLGSCLSQCCPSTPNTPAVEIDIEDSCNCCAPPRKRSHHRTHNIHPTNTDVTVDQVATIELKTKKKKKHAIVE